MRRSRFACFGFALAALAGAAGAQEYPAKPIRFIVGPGPDVLARIVGQKLNEAWGLILGSQMHDILPGTAEPLAYVFSWNDEVVALNRSAARNHRSGASSPRFGRAPASRLRVATESSHALIGDTYRLRDCWLVPIAASASCVSVLSPRTNQ